MSDIDPNRHLNQKRLQIELDTMKLNIQRMDLRLMELDEEKKTINENMIATTKHIDELQKRLAGN
jgi:hypothetical protein